MVSATGDNLSRTDPKENVFLSVVVPAYNEEEVLPSFHKRLSEVLDSMPIQAEIIYVNDGSTDNTLPVLQILRKSDPRIAILDLSRNFGKEIALTCGLDFAKGDATVVIDADLQDPPELINEFIRHWKDGFDVVYAQRIAREGETALKKTTARLFYGLMRRVSHVVLPENTGDYRLLSRRAVDSLKQLREHHRFMKGLFAWIGYPQKAVPFTREPRYAGKTKWNYWRLWNFALDGITSFTTMPLKLATYLGLFTATGAFIYGLYFLAKTLLLGNPVPVYPSLLVIMLFLGGVQLVALGIIGEYLGRMFNESKNRPLYFLKGYAPSLSQEDLSAAKNPGDAGKTL
jgi:glycosyltransferase involved in cell wall biosynthesis